MKKSLPKNKEKPLTWGRINDLSIEAWREEQRINDMSYEELAVEQCKEQLMGDARKEKAEEIKDILPKVATKKQLKIFMAFVNCGSFSEVATVLKIHESYVREVVSRVRQKVIKALHTPNFILL